MAISKIVVRSVAGGYGTGIGRIGDLRNEACELRRRPHRQPPRKAPQTRPAASMTLRKKRL